MKFIPQILFFFGAIGVFNSIIVSIYFLLSKKYEHLSAKIFGTFLLVLSLRILKSLFYSFSTPDPIYILQSGPAFFLLIGPLFLMYMLSRKRPNSFRARRWIIHFGFWLIMVSGLMFFFPFSENIAFSKKVLLPLVNLQWLAYLLIASWTLRLEIAHFKRSSTTDKWLVLVAASMHLLWLSLHFVAFDYFISGSILFSLLFYAFFLHFLINRKSAAIVFRNIGKDKMNTNRQEAADLSARLKTLLLDNKLYTNPDLKMPEVAQAVGVSTHELSRLVNTHLQLSFPDFLNQYRVEEAKKLLRQESVYTIEAIGNQAGFKSKSAFYKAFKKHTGSTPAKYKAETRP